MIREDVTGATRLAGLVERYHTWPTLTRQTVGEHTWQVMRIYHEIFGPMSPAVSSHILWHDAPEVTTGDPPFPIKARNPELKRVYDRLDGEWTRRHVGHLPTIGDEERGRIKICDNLEMWEHGLHEMALGNTYAEPIVTDTLAAAREIAAVLGSVVEARVDAYISRHKRIAA